MKFPSAIFVLVCVSALCFNGKLIAQPTTPTNPANDVCPGQPQLEFDMSRLYGYTGNRPTWHYSSQSTGFYKAVFDPGPPISPENLVEGHNCIGGQWQDKFQNLGVLYNWGDGGMAPGLVLQSLNVEQIRLQLSDEPVGIDTEKRISNTNSGIFQIERTTIDTKLSEYTHPHLFKLTTINWDFYNKYKVNNNFTVREFLASSDPRTTIFRQSIDGNDVKYFTTTRRSERQNGKQHRYEFLDYLDGGTITAIYVYNSQQATDNPWVAVKDFFLFCNIPGTAIDIHASYDIDDYSLSRLSLNGQDVSLPIDMDGPDAVAINSGLAAIHNYRLSKGMILVGWGTHIVQEIGDYNGLLDLMPKDVVGILIPGTAGNDQ